MGASSTDGATPPPQPIKTISVSVITINRTTRAIRSFAIEPGTTISTIADRTMFERLDPRLHHVVDQRCNVAKPVFNRTVALSAFVGSGLSDRLRVTVAANPRACR